MHYRKWSAVCRFDNGHCKKIEVWTNYEDAKLFMGKEEIPRMTAGTPKSLFIKDATGEVTEEEFIFDLGGDFVSVKPAGRYRPGVFARDGLCQFTFGRAEFLTVAVASAVFVAAILLAIFL